MRSLTHSFESVEQAQAVYILANEFQEETRLVMAGVSARVRDIMGRGGLDALSQATHRKRSTLLAEAEVSDIASLRDGRPTLTIMHLQVLRLVRGLGESVVAWADKTVDENWSPADLRRAIQASRRKPEDLAPDIVLKKADASADKFKSVVDQAVEAGVLEPVTEKAEGLVAYAKAKVLK
jgi:hypothetical protein